MYIPHPRRLAPGQWVQSLAENWAVSSQQQARRNAMVASTALAHRRAERMEVEEFLSSLSPEILTPATATTDAPTPEAPAPAAHG